MKKIDGTYYYEIVGEDDLSAFSVKSIDDLVILEYNGKMMPEWTWELIEETYEEEIVAALKKDGIWKSIEYSDDAADDDYVDVFEVFKAIPKNG